MVIDGESTVKKLLKTALFLGIVTIIKHSFQFNVTTTTISCCLFCYRSYYRCTTATCNVKKRVERSYNDPTIVVTTYEGQHNHPSPVMPRPSLAPITDVGGFSIQGTMSQYHQQPFVNTYLPLNNHPCNYLAAATDGGFVNEKRFVNQGQAALFKDHGLLQDMVPSHMLKEE